MTIDLHKPDITELKPRITVFGVGGGGGNAVNNMIASGLDGVEFVVANTDAQALTMSKAERLIQMGVQVTEGLGAGSQPEVGAAAAQECIDEIKDHLTGTHMAFVTAGMGGGTGTGAAPVVAQAAREAGILTVGVVTKPFSFEGSRRMSLAEDGIRELQKSVDTLIVIPNQNLFRVANDKTTFADAFSMADQVLYSGVACITDLMVKEGLINLDFADVRSVMREMGRAMMGTGEASGENRAMAAAEAAISNPLLDETSMAGSQGLLISITGGRDMTLFEVDEAATRIREEVEADANIILGATFDETLEGIIRVSVVATGIEAEGGVAEMPNSQRMNDAAERLRQSAQARTAVIAPALSEGEGESVPTKKAAQDDQSDSASEHAEIKIERSVYGEDKSDDKLSNGISEEDFQTAFDAQIQTSGSQPAAASAAPRSDNAQADQDQQVPTMNNFEPAPQSASPAQVPQVQAPQAEAENGPMGLLKRLATGLGNTTHESADTNTAPTAERSADPAPAPSAPFAREESDPYAPQQTGSLDAHGRTAAPTRLNNEEEQLDIPAFLRRQAN